MNQMTSVERIQEYADLVPEKNEQAKDVAKSWPEQGKVEFEEVSLRYSPGADAVLRSLCIAIQPREKVGIVGRTGAGKSSLIQALFRLAEIEGKIMIDGVDTKLVSLNKLRSKISIIPQEPVLFSGTLRKNLDPFDEYKDEVCISKLIGFFCEIGEIITAVDIHNAFLVGVMGCFGRSRTQISSKRSSSRSRKQNG